MHADTEHSYFDWLMHKRSRIRFTQMLTRLSRPAWDNTNPDRRLMPAVRGTRMEKRDGKHEGDRRS
jgi:hypothetical protein